MNKTRSTFNFDKILYVHSSQSGTMEFHVFFAKEGLTTLNLALYRAFVRGNTRENRKKITNIKNLILENNLFLSS
jgi:hypothetical protein